MSYLTFYETITIPGRKTAIWEVRSGQSQVLLGKISWYAPWRRYTYAPAGPQVMDAACLQEVADFLIKQMAKHKAKLADEKAVVS